MKYFDFEKAKSIIEENSENLQSATLGTSQDWFWTATMVWEDGRFLEPFYQVDYAGDEYESRFENLVKIGGIAGSDWDTPIIRLVFKNGEEFETTCYTTEMPTRYEYFLEMREKWNKLQKEKEEKAQREKPFEYTIGGL